MRAPYLGCAALAAIASFASPAQAQFVGHPGSTAGPAVTPHQLDGPSQFVDGPGRDRRHDGRRHRRSGTTVVVGGFGWNEGWALYNNRSFAPDSYNDWWHDRPDRAYPRWMQNNQDCTRLWWGGGRWRC